MKINTDDVKLYSEQVNIDPTSWATVQIDVGRHGTDCSALSSGFLWRENGIPHIVTNFHCLTGIDPVTNSSSAKFIPNTAKIDIFTVSKIEGNDGALALTGGQVTINLGEENNFIRPADNRIDLAAFPIQSLPGPFGYYCLNDHIKGIVGRMQTGNDCSVVGYPEGHMFERRSPLWKRASVATDMDLNQNGLPVFYVDTIGNSGLSGSPVLCRGFQIDQSGKQIERSDSNSVFLLGVYFGRLGRSGLPAQVGRVIKASCIEQMFADREPDVKQQ